MMQDKDKDVPSADTGVQVTEAASGTSDNAIKKAYVAATLRKEKPANDQPTLAHAANKPTGNTIIDDRSVAEDLIEEDVAAEEDRSSIEDDGDLDEGDDPGPVV
jgi:hypothetical protein